MQPHTKARLLAAANWALRRFTHDAGVAAEAPRDRKAATKPISKDLEAIAEEAYLYGYPLVLVDATMRANTNVPEPDSEHRAPLNQFAHVKTLPDDTFTDVVLPNVDTLYSSAFLDLSREPIVLHVPDTHGRYYLMPMLDAYTNVFASPGKRTTGTQAADFAIVGPDWKGSLPEGVRRIDAPTNAVWLIGRTQINGKDDLPEVAALVDQYSLTPLSSYGRPYTPPKNANVDPRIDMKTPPPKVVANLGDRAFFDRLARLLEKNPPPERDAPALAEFAKLGLKPGQFQPSAAATKAIGGVSQRAAERMRARALELGREANMWRIDTALGEYGVRYEARAAVALKALGANLPQDAVYPSVTRDARGEALNGRNRYVLHFDRGKEPPAKAFWSLTMYGMDNYLGKNPIDRFALGSRDALKRHPDGSLDILIQHERPSDDEIANWLPAPAGPFQMLLRMYWPEEKLVRGDWEPPPVERMSR